MSALKRTKPNHEVRWGICIECGNRYKSDTHGYKVSWCSRACEQTSIRRQRDEIQTSWMRARWFLR